MYKTARVCRLMITDIMNAQGTESAVPRMGDVGQRAGTYTANLNTHSIGGLPLNGAL